MNRREFLKLGGAASLFLFLPLVRLESMLPANSEVQMDGLRYRGTPDGKIYVSKDRGKTWDLHTFLGPDYSVTDIFADRRGKLFVDVRFQGYTFYLTLSADRKTWRTVA